MQERKSKQRFLCQDVRSSSNELENQIWAFFSLACYVCMFVNQDDDD